MPKKSSTPKGKPAKKPATSKKATKSKKAVKPIKKSAPAKKPATKVKTVKKAVSKKLPPKAAKKTAPKVATKTVAKAPAKPVSTVKAVKSSKEKTETPIKILKTAPKKLSKTFSLAEEVSRLLPKENIIMKESSNRKYFNDRIDKDIVLPNLIEIQLDSYRWFLDQGIRELLDEVSPITDFSGKKLELQFLEHAVEEPKYDPETCRVKNLTYEAPLKVHVQLINKETGEIKVQDVFLGAIPLMTHKGTFIINGIERVVVSQIVRSPGVFFSKNAGVQNSFNAKIIPKRGAWLEIETDKKGIISVKIDRKRKIPITSLLRVFGYPTDQEIRDLFTDVIESPEKDYILNTLEKDTTKTMEESYQNIYKKNPPWRPRYSRKRQSLDSIHVL
jgi:hypothetical protein